MTDTSIYKLMTLGVLCSWMDGQMNRIDAWKSQSQSIGGTRLFEDAADRALASAATGAWEAGSPGKSFLLLHLPRLTQSIANAIKLMEPVVL